MDSKEVSKAVKKENPEDEIRCLLGTDLDVKSAIQIAKIISHAPENRMRMILDVFSSAGLDISGLEEMECWQEIVKNQNPRIPDAEGFLRELVSDRKAYKGEYRIRPAEFNQFCRGRRLVPKMVRQALAGLSIIRTTVLANGKMEYSATVYDDATGDIYRCVCIKENWAELLKN